MSQVEISEAAMVDLQAIAEREHRVLSDVLSEAIETYVVAQRHEQELTAAQIARLKSSIDQANRASLSPRKL